MSNFVLLYLSIFCIFCTFVFFWTIHTNFHAKSGVCSQNFKFNNVFHFVLFVKTIKNSKNINMFKIILFFIFFEIIKLDIFNHNLFGQFIQTSMLNVESVAQKVAEL